MKYNWNNSIHTGNQVSTIKWYLDNHGPFVPSIYEEIIKHQDIFDVHLTENIYGKEKRIILLKRTVSYELNENERNSINKVIEATKDLSWDNFINIVYSTYPILTTEKYNTLNLRLKAKELNENKNT